MRAPEQTLHVDELTGERLRDVRGGFDLGACDHDDEPKVPHAAGTLGGGGTQLARQLLGGLVGGRIALHT